MKDNSQDILRIMFPVLKNAKVIDEKSRSSFNDGGHDVFTMWQDGEKYYRTTYNDWSVNHPDTRCYEVHRTEKMVIKYTNGVMVEQAKRT